MYKSTSRSLQRKNRVAEIQSSQVSDGDLIQSADNMGLRECTLERNQLLTERAGLENQLVAAKAQNDRHTAASLGHRIQNICARLSMLGRRIKKLNMENHRDAFHDAAREVLPPDLFRKVSDRQREILDEREALTA